MVGGVVDLADDIPGYRVSDPHPAHQIIVCIRRDMVFCYQLIPNMGKNRPGEDLAGGGVAGFRHPPIQTIVGVLSDQIRRIGGTKRRELPCRHTVGEPFY